MNVDGLTIGSGVSIGIAESCDVDSLDDPATMIRDADTAMYRAKEDGGGRVAVFDDDLRHRAVERQWMESALREAPIDGTLVLHYQPLVDLSSGRLRSVEALLRWRNGDRLVSPADFIPIAEETDLILPLGAWALRTACGQLERWQQMPGWRHLRMSVNVSVRQLQQPGFVDLLAEVMSRHHLRRGSLALEITESVLLDDDALLALQGDRLSELEPQRAQRIVIHCHHGGRSLRVANFLRQQGFAHAQSMAGGIDQWAVEIEPGMTRY